MRFYVICQLHSQEQEKIYVNFQGDVRLRSQLPQFFTLICPSTKVQMSYTPQEVNAEIGLEPLGGAIIGGLLFLIDPLLGLAGLLLGGLGANATEQQKVDAFNNSQVRLW